MKVGHEKTGVLRFTSPVHTALSLILEFSGVMTEVQKHVRNRFQIVRTKWPTIADKLVNSRRAAKRYDLKKEPKCVHDCKTEAHDLRQGEEFTGLIRHVLTQNAKNVPYPDFFDAKSELYQAFSEILPSLELIRPVESKETLLQGFQNNSPNMEKVYNQLNRAAEQSYRDPPLYATTMSQVLRAKSMLREWVVVEMDKNSGKLALMCPVRYYKAKMYINDSTHYTIHPHITQQMLLQQWQWHYDTHEWHTIAPIRTGPKTSVPYAHILPKFKDPSRYRAVVDCKFHPTNKPAWVCQKALMYIISTLSKTHFNLTKTQDFLKGMQTHMAELKQQNDQEIHFLPFSMDIKEMFTGLPQQTIKNAVDFLLQYATTLNRRNVVHIRVPKDRSEHCGWGKSANLSEVYQISFGQIRNVVKFHVGSAYFKVGEMILLQKAGVPIGGVLSTALAVATCVYSETSFLKALGPDLKNLRVIRYVDDITGLVAFLANDPTSFIQAQNLVLKLQNECYPEELVLKTEPIQKGKYKFLETITTVQGNTIKLRHLSKNHAHIKHHGIQKVYSIQHAHSYSPWSSKYGVALSRFIAISEHCSSRSLLVKSANEFFMEMQFLCYGTKFLRRTCQRMFRRSGDSIWLKLAAGVTKKNKR